jgi:AcrR family transcriptional regulator
MSIIVEHDKRRREILEKALDVFMDEGYEDATFQKIADRCGITRTTLYIYFKNKREIFSWSIKQLMAEVESDLAAVVSDQAASSKVKLTRIVTTVILRAEENRRLCRWSSITCCTSPRAARTPTTGCASGRSGCGTSLRAS